MTLELPNMHEPANGSNDYHLDVLGQHTLIDVYTQICLCFTVPDASSHSAIIATLTNGLERLSASFPWIAGQLVNESSGGASGIFKIKPLEKIPRLVIRDLRNDPSIPTMDALKRADFPFSMLDENVIAPRKTLSESSDIKPVFLLQANFITGGLLLTILAQHNIMDMIGQGQVMDLFSKACRNEQFTSEELSSGNVDRRNLVPLLDDSYKQGPELAHQIMKPNSNDPEPTPPPPKCTWSYFIFDPTSLTALKSIVSKTITSGYISTDDALTALIWQSITRARLPRLNASVESTLSRAVDVRRYLGISETYPGLMQNMTYHTYTLQKLVEEPLGGVASYLRAAVDPKTSSLAYDTRALVTFVDRTPDKNAVSFTATVDQSSGIMLSSWAKIDCYNLDFNLGLGKPEAVRRPQFDPCESLLYFMPKRPDGQIAVGICLRDEDMDRLRADKEFTKYGRYVEDG